MTDMEDFWKNNYSTSDQAANQNGLHMFFFASVGGIAFILGSAGLRRGCSVGAVASR